MPSLTFDNLRSRVLATCYQGSTDAGNITAAGLLVNDGYQLFLSAHDWSFLKTTATLSLAADVLGTYTLPAGFQEMLGDFILTSVTNGRLQRVPVETLLTMVEQSDSATGIPAYYAIRPVAFVVATGQQWEVMVHPWPDVAYASVYSYRPEVAALSATGDYPMGGALHSMTILQAALMLWEQRNGLTNGVQHRLFYGAGNAPGMLEMSIRRDAESRAAILGGTPSVSPAVIPHGLVTYS